MSPPLEVFDEPSCQHPWFVYDQVDYRFYYFKTQQQAREYFEKEIRPFYQEADAPGYAADISWVTVGRITDVVDCTAHHTHCILHEL